MKILWSLILAAVAALIAMPALAGGEKCSASTQECLDYMAGKMKDSGWVGIELDINDEGRMTVTKVVPGSPAENGGMQSGDVLFAMYGIEFSDANEERLAKAKKDWTPGQAVTYTVRRGDAKHEINLTLAPMPAHILAQWIGNHMLQHATLETASNTEGEVEG